MEINNTINRGMTRKAMFNAKNSSKDVKDIMNKSVNIVGYQVCDEVDKASGEIIKIGYILTDDNQVYGFKSETLIDNLIDFDSYCTDIFGDDEKFSETVTISSGKSKAGREFYTLNII